MLIWRNRQAVLFLSEGLDRIREGKLICPAGRRMTHQQKLTRMDSADYGFA
jgi:hypothetical protein